MYYIWYELIIIINDGGGDDDGVHGRVHVSGHANVHAHARDRALP